MNNLPIKYYAYGFLGYAFLVTWVYTAIYWSVFNIDIFPYVNLLDIIKFPAAKIAIVTLAVAGFLSFLLHIPIENKKDNGKVINYKKRMLIFKIGGFAFVIIWMFWAFWMKSTVVFTVLGIIATWFIVMYVIEKYLLKSKNVLLVMVFSLAVWYPFIMISYAFDNAYKIIDGTYYDVVEDPKLKDKLHQKEFKYLGTIGNYIFLMTFDNQHVILTQFGSEDYLVFDRKTRKSPKD